MDAFDNLSNYIEELEQGGKQARKRVIELVDEVNKLKEENKKLNEFKDKREENMFYFKALAEKVEPINSKEAEELQKTKKLFEKLYREELYYLEKENKNLKKENEELKEYKSMYEGLCK